MNKPVRLSGLKKQLPVSIMETVEGLNNSVDLKSKASLKLYTQRETPP
jgi:hypothetical protein